MKFIKEFMTFFVNITTGILIVCALNFAISDSAAIPRNTLWQILLAGGVTALLTTIVYRREISSTKQFLLLVAVHYTLLCVIMILFGVWFGWMSLNFAGILMMMVSVAVVYGFTFFCRYLLAKKEADYFNKALQDKYKD